MLMLEITEIAFIGMMTTTMLMGLLVGVYAVNRMRKADFERLANDRQKIDQLLVNEKKVHSAQGYQVAGLKTLTTEVKRGNEMLVQLLKLHPIKIKPTLAQKIPKLPVTNKPNVQDSILDIIQNECNSGDSRFLEIYDKVCVKHRVCSKQTLVNNLKKMMQNGKLRKNGNIYSV